MATTLCEQKRYECGEKEFTSTAAEIDVQHFELRVAVVGDVDSGHDLLMRKIEFQEEIKGPRPVGSNDLFFGLNKVTYEECLNDTTTVDLHICDLSAYMQQSSSFLQTWIQKAHVMIVIYKGEVMTPGLEKFIQQHETTKQRRLILIRNLAKTTKERSKGKNGFDKYECDAMDLDIEQESFISLRSRLATIVKELHETHCLPPTTKKGFRCESISPPPSQNAQVSRSCVIL